MGDRPQRPSPVEDLVEACEKITAFTRECTEDQFYQSPLIWSAVAYQIIVLGEAAKGLHPQIREHYENIPWKLVIGMRDILSHKYDTIDLQEIWDTVQKNVPKLLSDLREIQSALQG